MFRITIDKSYEDYNHVYFFIHKKLLFWWVKWYIAKSPTCCKSTRDTYLNIKKGKYNFSSGEHSTYWSAIYPADWEQPAEIIYVNSAEEFKDKNIECFI